MQVIIVQAEIETAIRNHILSLITVNEGMRVDVDLAATRGKDGFSATIDIVPESSEPSKKSSEPEQEVVTNTPEVAEKKTPGPKPKGKVLFAPKKAEPEVQVAEPQVAEETSDPKEEEPAPVDATSSNEEPAFTPSEPDTETQPAEPPVARSLFGALRKPVNS